jgi:hypothetical protein
MFCGAVLQGKPKFRSEIQEVFEEMFAFGREDGLRVELDTVDGEGFVLQAHDFAFGRFGGDFQDIG